MFLLSLSVAAALAALTVVLAARRAVTRADRVAVLRRRDSLAALALVVERQVQRPVSVPRRTTDDADPGATTAREGTPADAERRARLRSFAVVGPVEQHPPPPAPDPVHALGDDGRPRHAGRRRRPTWPPRPAHRPPTTRRFTPVPKPIVTIDGTREDSVHGDVLPGLVGIDAELAGSDAESVGSGPGLPVTASPTRTQPDHRKPADVVRPAPAPHRPAHPTRQMPAAGSVAVPDAEPSATPSAGQRVRRLAAVAAALLAVVAIGVGQRNPDAAPPVAAANPDVVEASPLPLDLGPPTTPIAPIGALGDVVAFDVTPPLSLDLAAAQATWVQVRLRGGVVLWEGTLQPGDATQVSAPAAVDLRTGNPAGLATTVNGRLLDHPRPPGQPLTFAIG